MFSKNIIFTKSPGRINIIGEHTDHQNGFVLPTTIDSSINFFVNERNDSRVSVYSEYFGEYDNFDLTDLSKNSGWKNYVRGIINKFHSKFSMSNGVNIVITSNLPIGAGISSSAALEVGLYTSLETIFEKNVSDNEAILDCWDVENNYVGLSCGIMDQFIVRLGKKGYAIKLNCDNLDFSYQKLPKDINFIIINTGIKHILKETPYNQRISELKLILNKLNKNNYQLRNLSQISFDQLEKIKKLIPEIHFRRLRHVVTENMRVNAFAELLMNDIDSAGQLLYQSHQSLQYDFEASWKEADNIVEMSKSIKGIYGARMLGGGWGGSVLLMVNSIKTNLIMKKLNLIKRKKWGHQYSFHKIKVNDGVKSKKINDSDISENVKDILSELNR